MIARLFDIPESPHKRRGRIRTMHDTSLRNMIGMALLVATLVGCTPSPSPLAQENSSSSTVSSAPSSVSKGPQPDWATIPGALVKVEMRSTVGVLLDEIPQNERDAMAKELLTKPESFWQDRAKRQVRLTSLRLNFRNMPPKKQLPLPPESQWEIRLHEPVRTNVDGHDIVTREFDFSGILLSDEASPGQSEPALQNIGGVWSEPFVLPIDPEFIFQRTGFACFNESQFPPNSVDAEEADLFYDDRCAVESKLTNTGCHQTQMPTQSCKVAVSTHIGAVKTAVRFERLAWSQEMANRVRLGEFSSLTGPDLQPDRDRFVQHRITYRYIPSDSCTIEEKCVGGPGWRKLLMFPTADLNVGAEALDIGLVDYFHKTGGTTLSERGMFELSECHNHYHFSHYGTFTLGEATNAISRKNGFCMQPTARLMNNELSPLHHPYTDCEEQGVSVGWIDEYKMGLECQWLDVTDVAGNKTYPLSFVTNPDGMLCEGTLKRDAQGKQLFEPSPFKTSQGTPVERPQCDKPPQWAANNKERYDVRIPENGESYVTEPCREGLFGKLRNCGLQNHKAPITCQAGKRITVRCTVPERNTTHVVRFCEASRALGVGIPCTYNDALAAGVLDAEKDFTFTCPKGRDSVETGGTFSYLSGPLLPGEASAQVTCELQ